jgi:hypothetical protein
VPIVSGPVSVILLAGVLIVALVLWLLRDRRYPGPRLHGGDEVDREELELEAGALPDEERPGDDWGPGTGRPRPPTRL